MNNAHDGDVPHPGEPFTTVYEERLRHPTRVSAGTNGGLEPDGKPGLDELPTLEQANEMRAAIDAAAKARSINQRRVAA